MFQKVIEDAIISSPQEYLKEDGLKFVSRNYHIKSFMFNLLFEDKNGKKLLLDIHPGVIDINASYKAIDFIEENEVKNLIASTRLIVIANKIPAVVKRNLIDNGISFLEIPEYEFLTDKAQQKKEIGISESFSTVSEKSFSSGQGFSNEEDLNNTELIKNLLPTIKANSAWIKNINAVKHEFFFKQNIESKYKEGKNWMIRNRFKFKSGSAMVDYFIYSDKYYHSVNREGPGIAVSFYISKKNLSKYGFEKLRSDLENIGFYSYAKNSPNIYDKWFMKSFVDETGKSLYQVNPENVKKIFLEENEKIASVILKHFS